MKYIFLFFIFLYTSLYAYIDNDFDGVEDSIDRCLNTPFEDLVNKYGCALNKPYKGDFDLSLTTSFENQDIQNTLNLSYIYQHYMFSSSWSKTSSLTLGYLFIYNNSTLLPSISIDINKNILATFNYAYLYKNYKFSLLNYYIENQFIYAPTVSYFQDKWEIGVSYFSTQQATLSLNYTLNKNYYILSDITQNFEDSSLLQISFTLGIYID